MRPFCGFPAFQTFSRRVQEAPISLGKSRAMSGLNETLEVRKLFCPFGALLWRPKKATAVGENPRKTPCSGTFLANLPRCKEYLPTFSFKKKYGFHVGKKSGPMDAP